MDARIPVYCVYSNQGHAPLAPGMIVSYAMAHAGGSLNASYEFVPTLLTSLDVARAVVAGDRPCVLLCSNYWWTVQQNLEIAAEVKRWHPGTVTIHGGPSTPKYESSCREFFVDNACVDVAVHGEGEVTLAEIFEALASSRVEGPRDLTVLDGVAGLSYRGRPDATGTTVVRTADRDRLKDLDLLPSPYLNGWFRASEAESWIAAIIETNRGCPYGCTFCDWGSATLSKIRSFSLERVRAELEWIARRHVQILWIADANFGIFARDVDIAHMIAEMKHDHGYPREVIVNYAKNATERIADIVTTLTEAGISTAAIIAIQSQDPQTLKAIRRSNIRTDRYEALIGVFRARNLPVSSDFMYALPGSTVESLKEDLQFSFDRRVYANAYPTVLLPNSPMAHDEYMREFEITVDERSLIRSTKTFTADDRRTMDRIVRAYKLFVGYAILKYRLYHLQVDHGVRALDLLDVIQRRASTMPDRVPRTAFIFSPTGGRPKTPSWGGELERALYEWNVDDWAEFHDEITRLVEVEFGVSPDSASESIVDVQTALMPRGGRRFPETIRLRHDVPAYFAAMLRIPNLAAAGDGELPRLASYSPGTLEVSDAEDICGHCEDGSTVVYQNHRVPWELHSELSASSIVNHFVDLAPVRAGGSRPTDTVDAGRPGLASRQRQPVVLRMVPTT